MANTEGLKGIRASRRQVVLGSLATAGAAILAGRFIFGRERRVPGYHWYEVVQDVRQLDLWHVNLYAGPVRGDLAKGKLVSRWTRTSDNISTVKHGLENPWRIQYLDGPQEQSF